MAKFDAVIFDFDGLILDTETVEYRSWAEAYSWYGVELDVQIWGQCIGRAHGFFNAHGHMQELAGHPIDKAEVEAKRVPLFYEMLNAQAILPGVIDRLDELAALGLKHTVASSSDLEWVGGHLHRLGLRERFPDQLYTKESFTNSKPNPEIFLTACAGLGVEPSRAIVFEDSPNGITAAKAAGCYCIAVPNHVTGQLDVSHADEVVQSLEEISLASY